MKTISIPVNDRPELLTRCLAAIRACPTWREWRIVFSCEPPARESIEQLVMSIPNAVISRNQVKLGCRHNTFHTATIAMSSGSEINLYLEDDCVISVDALTLVDRWSEAHHGGIICLRRWHDTQNGQATLVKPANHGLLGNGFAFNRAMWATISKYWFYDQDGNGGKMWDWSLDRGLQQEAVTQWRPMVNRSKNIGVNGTHSQGSNDVNHFGPSYEGASISSFQFVK